MNLNIREGNELKVTAKVIMLTATAAASAIKYIKSPSFSSCKAGKKSECNMTIILDSLLGNRIHVYG